MGDRTQRALAPIDVGLTQTIEECRPLVVRICRSRLSGLPAADIEDAVQDTFLQFAAADRSRIINVEAWLIAVALRMCAHTLRDRYKSKEIPLSDTPIIHSVADALDQADEQLWVAKITSLLPTADMKLLHMLYIQDMPYGEVARYLHISNGHARVLAYRARQHARAVIDGLQ
jgi:RNA polymerase sigma-70 factor (ECF subfamily)